MVMVVVVLLVVIVVVLVLSNVKSGRRCLKIIFFAMLAINASKEKNDYKKGKKRTVAINDIDENIENKKKRKKTVKKGNLKGGKKFDHFCNQHWTKKKKENGRVKDTKGVRGSQRANKLSLLCTVNYSMKEKKKFNANLRWIMILYESGQNLSKIYRRDKIYRRGIRIPGDKDTVFGPQNYFCNKLNFIAKNYSKINGCNADAIKLNKTKKKNALYHKELVLDWEKSGNN
ncbi:hypothetical protein LOAG_07029 [Loa loa]|uniref:Uncharacterized protein n=1 Tax=Loa loa TaxID=7209 RepID=A0A1S0TWT4_LOALO|nr:hypothetical protein LOAG_07029 [Loa loa]EFO21460.1 hypothetical protein LOAG_07029 [Loa loa]